MSAVDKERIGHLREALEQIVRESQEMYRSLANAAALDPSTLNPVDSGRAAYMGGIASQALQSDDRSAQLQPAREACQALAAEEAKSAPDQAADVMLANAVGDFHAAIVHAKDSQLNGAQFVEALGTARSRLTEQLRPVVWRAAKQMRERRA